MKCHRHGTHSSRVKEEGRQGLSCDGIFDLRRHALRRRRLSGSSERRLEIGVECPSQPPLRHQRGQVSAKHPASEEAGEVSPVSIAGDRIEPQSDASPAEHRAARKYQGRDQNGACQPIRCDAIESGSRVQRERPSKAVTSPQPAKISCSRNAERDQPESRKHEGDEKAIALRQKRPGRKRCQQSSPYGSIARPPPR
jgi:hypothetical protein